MTGLAHGCGANSLGGGSGWPSQTSLPSRLRVALACHLWLGASLRTSGTTGAGFPSSRFLLEAAFSGRDLWKRSPMVHIAFPCVRVAGSEAGAGAGDPQGGRGSCPMAEDREKRLLSLSELEAGPGRVAASD